MKNNIVIVLVVAIVLSFLLMTIGYAANEIIEAYLGFDFKFKVNDESWVPKETDGSLMYPIIYKGRTYIPARALLESQNVDVDYDESTKTIIIGFPEEDGSSKDPAYTIPPVGSIDENAPVFFKQVGQAGDAYERSADSAIYELVFNDKFILGQMQDEVMISFDMGKDVKLMANGKEIKIEDINTEGRSFLLNEDGKLIYEIGENDNMIKAVIFEGIEIKNSDSIEKGTVLRVLKTKHDTVKNSINNVR